MEVCLYAGADWLKISVSHSLEMSNFFLHK